MHFVAVLFHERKKILCDLGIVLRPSHPRHRPTPLLAPLHKCARDISCVCCFSLAHRFCDERIVDLFRRELDGSRDRKAHERGRFTFHAPGGIPPPASAIARQRPLRFFLFALRFGKHLLFERLCVNLGPLEDIRSPSCSASFIFPLPI